MTNRFGCIGLSRKRAALLAFSVTVAILAVLSFLFASDFPRGARLFPQVVSVILFFLAAISLVSNLVSARNGSPEVDEGLNTADLTSDVTLSEVWPYFAWVIGTFVGMYLIGFFPAAGLFCLLFLWRVARMRWWANLAMTSLCLTTVLILGIGLNITWPRGILTMLPA